MRQAMDWIAGSILIQSKTYKTEYFEMFIGRFAAAAATTGKDVECARLFVKMT